MVGKPILQSDASNTGWISQTDLSSFAVQAFDQLGWYAGIMHWQYPSDKSGAAIEQAASALIQRCQQSGKCQ